MGEARAQSRAGGPRISAYFSRRGNLQWSEQAKRLSRNIARLEVQMWQPWVATHGKETPQPPHACNQRCGSHWAPTGKAGTTSSHSLLELRPERVARRANVTQAAPEAGTSYKAATKAAWSRAWRRGTSQGRQQHIHLGIQVIDGHRLTLDDSMQLTGASTTTVRGERRRIGTLAPEVRAARRTGSAGCS